MASRWTRHPSSPDSSENTIDHPSLASPDSVSRNPRQVPPPLDNSCIKYILSVMVLFMRQTASPEVPLMVATRSTDTAFRDFQNTVDMGAAAKSVSPPPRPLSAEHSLRNRPSASSVLSGNMSIDSTSYIAATSAEYEITHVSLVNSSPAINDLIVKYIRQIIFNISASNWKVVFDRLSTKINFIATHPELNPDSMDLQLMSHGVLDRTRLVIFLNRTCPINDLFFTNVVEQMDRTFVVAGQHENGVPACNCGVSEICHLELD